ncbi:unnamed protein product, partial [Ectocarpus sp. 8 AP-2014]
RPKQSGRGVRRPTATKSKNNKSGPASISTCSTMYHTTLLYRPRTTRITTRHQTHQRARTLHPSTGGLVLAQPPIEHPSPSTPVALSPNPAPNWSPPLAAASVPTFDANAISAPFSHCRLRFRR